MEDMLNPDHFDAPHIEFDDLPSGMGEKIEVGDKIVAKAGDEETVAEVIRIDQKNGYIFLTKELPKDADEYVVKETSTNTQAPFDAIQKAAASEESSEDEQTEDVLTGPLPKLKEFLIQISIKE